MSETPVNRAGSFHGKLLLAGMVAVALLLATAIWLASSGGANARVGSDQAGAKVETDGGHHGGVDGAPAAVVSPNAPAGTTAPSAVVPGVAPINVSGDAGANPSTDRSDKARSPSFKDTLPADWPKGDTTGCTYVSQQLEAFRGAVGSGGVDAVRELLAPIGDLQGDPAAAKVSQDFDNIRRLWSTAVSEADNGGMGRNQLAEADKVIASALKKLKCP